MKRGRVFGLAMLAVAASPAHAKSDAMEWADNLGDWCQQIGAEKIQECMLRLDTCVAKQKLPKAVLPHLVQRTRTRTRAWDTTQRRAHQPTQRNYAYATRP